MEREMYSQKGGKIQIASCIRTSFQSQGVDAGRSPSKQSEYSQYSSVDRQNISYSDVYTNKASNSGELNYFGQSSPPGAHPKGSAGYGGSNEGREAFHFDYNERELRNQRKIDIFDDQYGNWADASMRKDR
jgi:hypothetical protein